MSYQLTSSESILPVSAISAPCGGDGTLQPAACITTQQLSQRLVIEGHLCVPVQVWAGGSFFFQCEIISSSYLLFSFLWTVPDRGCRSQSPVSISSMSGGSFLRSHRLIRSLSFLCSASVWPLLHYHQDIWHACCLTPHCVHWHRSLPLVFIEHFCCMFPTNSIVIKIIFTLLYLITFLLQFHQFRVLGVPSMTHRNIRLSRGARSIYILYSS